MNQKQYHGVTVNDLYNALHKEFQYLVDEILHYESDTFSSEASALTPAEAEKIAFNLVLHDIEQRRVCNTMDGIAITEELETIRN